MSDRAGLPLQLQRGLVHKIADVAWPRVCPLHP